MCVCVGVCMCATVQFFVSVQPHPLFHSMVVSVQKVHTGSAQGPLRMLSRYKWLATWFKLLSIIRIDNYKFVFSIYCIIKHFLQDKGGEV